MRITDRRAARDAEIVRRVSEGQGASQVAHSMGLTPKIVNNVAHGNNLPRTRWKAEWVRLRSALKWRYGADRAAQVLAGQDDATNADLAAWRALGSCRA